MSVEDWYTRSQQLTDLKQDAVNLLESRRRAARPTSVPVAVEGLGDMPKNSRFKGAPSLTNMKPWLDCLGYSQTDIDDLNIVHVAGTKGKGSTCAFISFLLRAHQESSGFPKRIGLYTSPHLKETRERIQINCRPLSGETFAANVFEVWERLTSTNLPRPRYLQLLFLVAIHTFIKEHVDAAICETHNGGEYDATNIALRPAVTGISTIGMDHVEQLGPTIENIAWHKAGIIKSDSSAFSTLQESAVTAVLDRRAKERGAVLNYVGIDSSLPLGNPIMKQKVQKANASLALAMTRSFLEEKAPTSFRNLSREDIEKGIGQFFWIGRFQYINQGRHQWFLDGAHNEMSVVNAAEWFADSIAQTQKRLADLTPNSRSRTEVVRPVGECSQNLIFSHISQRDGAALLRSIAKTLRKRNVSIANLIISTYEEQPRTAGEALLFYDYTPLVDQNTDENQESQPTTDPLPWEMQQQYFDAWETIYPNTNKIFQPTIEGALHFVRSSGKELGTQTLITGSLSLVGGALRLLEPQT